MRKKWLAWLGYLILIPSLLLNGWQFFQNKYQRGTYLVTGIIDGDTLVTEDDSIIRLFSVDAPALTSCGGQEAKQALTDAVLNKRVSFDVKAREEHGRQIALVYLGKSLVNAKLLETGWFTYEGGQAVGRDLMKNAITKARENKLGIFSNLCSQKENPDNPECLIKGNIGKTGTNEGKKTYHFPGCSLYETVLVEKFRDEQWFCTEAEARAAGFIKSSECHEKKFENFVRKN